MNDILKKETVRNMRNNPDSRTRENEYWTDEELARLKELFDDGEDITDIAIIFQRSEPAILQQVILMNLYSRKSRTGKKSSEEQKCKCLCGQCSRDPDTCPHRMPPKNHSKKRR